jgi:hypothetical protein
MNTILVLHKAMSLAMRADAVRALWVFAGIEVLPKVGHVEPPVDTAPRTKMYLIFL